MDVRNANGEQVALVVGMWYVGVNRDQGISFDEPLLPMIPASNWHWGCGEIAQYVGDNEFYDEHADEPTRLQDYDYIVEQHMGKLPCQHKVSLPYGGYPALPICADCLQPYHPS